MTFYRQQSQYFQGRRQAPKIGVQIIAFTMRVHNPHI